jgi:hypothetical protein
MGEIPVTFHAVTDDAGYLLERIRMLMQQKNKKVTSE